VTSAVDGAGGPEAAGARALATADGPRKPKLQVTIELARLVLARRCGDLRGLDAAAGRLLAFDQPGGPRLRPAGLRARVLTAQAHARMLLAWPRAAEAVLGGFDLAGEASAAAALELLATAAELAAYQLRRRHPDDAEARALELLEHDPLLHRPPALDLATGWRAFARADFGTAVSAFARAADRLASEPDLARSVGASILHARAQAAAGDVLAGRSLLQRVARDASRIGGLLEAAHARELARIETGLARPHAGRRLRDRLAGSAWWALVAAEAARACLAGDDLAGAQICLEAALTADGDLSRRDRVAALLCRAQLHVRLGEGSATCGDVLQAVDVAAGLVVEPFLAAGAGLRDVLADHPELAARLPGNAAGTGCDRAACLPGLARRARRALDRPRAGRAPAADHRAVHGGNREAALLSVPPLFRIHLAGQLDDSARAALRDLQIMTDGRPGPAAGWTRPHCTESSIERARLLGVDVLDELHRVPEPSSPGPQPAQPTS